MPSAAPSLRNVTSSPAARNAPCELAHAPEPGLRGPLVVTVRTPGEQPAQLHERLPPRRLDRAQRRTRLVRALVEDVVGRRRLDDDHRDGVGDHVVQLARDARLLVGDRPPRLCSIAAPRLREHLAERPGHDQDRHREARVLAGPVVKLSAVRPSSAASAAARRQRAEPRAS